MISTETYKEAGKLYSRYRPRKVVQDLTTTVAAITPPANTLGVEYCGYGVEVPYYEVVTSTGADLLFAWEDQKLHIYPTPTEATTFRVIWRVEHQYNAVSKSFPTIPREDLTYVDLIEELVYLKEQALMIEGEPSRVIIGHAEISDENRMRDMNGRIRLLEDQIRSALVDTVGGWG